MPGSKLDDLEAKLRSRGPGPAGNSFVKNLLLETLLVAAAGLALGFAANAFSPRGLTLGRNYFPQDNVIRTPASLGTNTGATVTHTNLSPEALLAERLHAQGLKQADSNLVARLFHDPRGQQNLVVFVDARNDTEYKEGHIPGAYQLDYFHPTDYLGTVLPICGVAEQVVVYCNGGNCDDSLGTATFLVSAKIPKEKILVYVGGITEWSTNGMPVEIGERQSGQIRNPEK